MGGLRPPGRETAHQLRGAGVAWCVSRLSFIMWAMYPASHLAGCTACSYMQPGDAMPSDLRGLGSYRRPGDEYPAGYLCGLGAPPAVLVGRTVVGLPHLTSGAILLSGTLSALSLALFASDRAESGYALGILAALSGAVLGAIRVFGEE